MARPLRGAANRIGNEPQFGTSQSIEMSAPAVNQQLPSIGRLHHVSRRYDLLALVKGLPRCYLHPAVIEAGLERALGYFTSWAGWKPCLSMMPRSPRTSSTRLSS